MTPKKKAINLINGFLKVGSTGEYHYKKTVSFLNKSEAKQCAMICIEELIENSTDGCMECGGGGNMDRLYLAKVKQELEKL